MLCTHHGGLEHIEDLPLAALGESAALLDHVAAQPLLPLDELLLALDVLAVVPVEVQLTARLRAQFLHNRMRFLKRTVS